MRITTWILFAAVVVSASACGAGGSTARNHGGETATRTETEELPEHGSISEGKYATEEFEPAFSIRIEEHGWQVLPPEARDSLAIATRSSLVIFLNVPRVFDPNELRQETQKPAPEDLVAWIEHHPWLDASTPQPASVGGVEGQQIDVTAARLPKDHLQVCGGFCVPLFAWDNLSSPFWISLDEKVRFVILEDVKGETVTIAIDTTPEQFEKFIPKAQRILDSVEWKVEP
jgi:hypothetical protein